MHKTNLLLTILCLNAFIIGFLPYPIRAAPITLAQQINDVMNAVDWNSCDSDVVHLSVIFKKATLSQYDDAIKSCAGSADWIGVIKTKRNAEVDDYNSATIDLYLKQGLTNQPMLSYLPQTYQNNYLVYHRYMLHGYKYAEQLSYEIEKWNKTAAYNDFSRIYDLAGRPFLYCNPITDSFGGSRRYYDECAETLGVFMKFSELDVSEASARANQVWEYINTYNWNEAEQYYPYIGTSGIVECEVAFHTIIGELYAFNNRTLPYMDRCTSDINYKLLQDGWASKLWSNYTIRHAETNPQLRLENTLNAFQVMHTYYPYPSFNSIMRDSFIQLLTGSPKAWQGLLQSGLYSDASKRFRWSSTGSYDNGATATGAMLLFLDGIIPSTGSLAIPLNDEYYEDTVRSFPASHFSFDYPNTLIKIPVLAGELKFQFGSTVTSYEFPENGIYEVDFNSDWSSITNATKFASLDPRFSYLVDSVSPALPTYTLTLPVAVGGTTSPPSGIYSYTASSTVQVTAVPNTDYQFNHWILDNSTVSSANPYTVLMSKNHTLEAVFTLVPPPLQLSITINPLSVTLYVSQSLTFTSRVGGGTAPYTYQWYLNSNPVSDATSSNWTFTPTTSGIYYVNLKVIDNDGRVVQSDTGRIQTQSIPVGGYSRPLTKPAENTASLPYTMFLAVLSSILCLIRHRQNKQFVLVKTRSGKPDRVPPP